ncbi:endonuclease III domain-containing protein [Pandoraea fibrosis]|uniref:DNA-3-methyladenine glycosylase II n=1 Tax=Pandoraea fibrosis TaxID=1891094 RepID=A0A5E4TB50_9BURK|nr:endonuclease III domain-containing protein [Pandoraea fibrosis]VVD83319.1 endonuclease III domain-containing protein [Pandoraea fibrosis]
MVTRKSAAAKVATKTATAKTAKAATKVVKSAASSTLAGDGARRAPVKATIAKTAAVKTGSKTAAGKTTEKPAKAGAARKVAQKTAPKAGEKVARKAPAKSTTPAAVTKAAKPAAPSTSASSRRVIAKRDGETRIVTPEIERIDHEIVEQVVTGVVPLPVGAGATRPGFWDQACADLMKRDRILKKLIPQFGPAHLTGRGEPFVTLARSIVGQQISVKAAQAVWDRVVTICPKLTPAQFIKAGHDTLAGCGLSRRKAEYILDLATHFKSGALHVDAWASMDDEAVIAELTGIRGIGRWTAEMFLMFNLVRPDVLPLDDVGLINAISVNYFSGEPVTRSEAREVAANWEPWRSVATWYMWRSLEPVPVEY